MAPRQRPPPPVARPIPPPSANEAAALADVFDDLCLRFLYNLPESEFESFPRLFFAVEQAYWFYLDFSREAQRSLPPMSLRTFARRLFEHSPPLRPHLPRLDELVADWKSYKGDIPTCGAALLNEALDKVLLVRAYGSGGRWGFPKGKIGKDETPFAAAMREVAEEVGYDATPLANERDALVSTSYTHGPGAAGGGQAVAAAAVAVAAVEGAVAAVAVAAAVEGVVAVPSLALPMGGRAPIASPAVAPAAAVTTATTPAAVAASST